MMRKLWILSFAVVLLLAACTARSGPSGIPPTTAPTTVPTTAPTTEPTVPSQPTVLTEEEQFQKLINDEYWYRRALGCTFEKGEDISLKFFFYTGMPNGAYHSSTFTAEETAYLNSAYREKHNADPHTDATKLPVSEINKALSALNVTIEDVTIPADWVYYDKTDAYYFWVSDAYGVVGWNVTEVEKGTDGITKVYWEVKDVHLNTATGEFWNDGVKMVLTLKEGTDGTYLIVSNLPVQ